MKIAVTYDNGKVFQHFGRTESFKLFNIDNNEIISSEIISNGGVGHEALAGLLAGHDIDVLICGGLGAGAQAALAEAGIEVCAGAEGDVDEAVAAWLKGDLKESDALCDHHDHEHEEGHDCGGCHDEKGCGGCGGCHSAPQIEGKNVGRKCAVHYKGTFNDGSQFDSSYDRGQPLEFVCGAGMMIFGFDKAVADMEPGEIKNVHLMPEEAYGYANPAAVMKIEIAALRGSENLEVGQRVAVTDELGRRFPVRVTAKDDKYITLDANHEMAGKELNFTIELVSVE